MLQKRLNQKNIRSMLPNDIVRVMDSMCSTADQVALSAETSVAIPCSLMTVSPTTATGKFRRLHAVMSLASSACGDESGFVRRDLVSLTSPETAG